MLNRKKRKIILFIAASIDGKIARLDGDVSWLGEVPNPDETDHGYMDFYQTIDTTLMGNSTYKMIESFGGEFPYPDKNNYVFTRDKNLQDTEYVQFISDDIPSFVEQLKKQKGDDIWLVGGAEINGFFLENNLIDEIMLFVMPLVLGDGISLFYGHKELKPFRVKNTKQYSTGAVLLHYEKTNAK